MFWLKFSSQYSDELCGLMDSYATLKRGIVSREFATTTTSVDKFDKEHLSSGSLNGSEASVLNQSLQLVIAANKIKNQVQGNAFWGAPAATLQRRHMHFSVH
jgi:hypothetical protein